MYANSAQIVQYIRYLIRDYELPNRKGLIYSDLEIINSYNGILTNIILGLARNGFYHHIGGALAYQDYAADGSANYPLPSNFLWGVALTWDWQDLPLYNANDALWGTSMWGDVNRPHGIIDKTNGNLEIFSPFPIDTGTIVLIYVVNDHIFTHPTLSTLTGCSRTLYMYAADSTVIKFLQRDAGSIAPHDASPVPALYSVVQRMVESRSHILQSNGIALPSIEGIVL
jgi:hypothetical protein